MNTPSTSVLIGNPGVGKSTILNALVGRAVFESGVAFGEGMTKEIKIHSLEGNTFIDTPGLADVNLRKKAAEEIEKALKSGGNFRVVFVITLEAGRVRPDDKTTIKLVLDSVRHIDFNYCIVVNKVTKQVLTKLNNIPAEKTKLLTTILQDLPTTPFVYFNQFNSELEDASDVVVPNSELSSFLSNIKPVPISAADVQPIQYQQFDEVCEKLSKVLDELKNDNTKLEAAIKFQEQEYQRLLGTMSSPTRSNPTPVDPTPPRPTPITPTPHRNPVDPTPTPPRPTPVTPSPHPNPVDPTPTPPHPNHVDPTPINPVIESHNGNFLVALLRKLVQYFMG